MAASPRRDTCRDAQSRSLKFWFRHGITAASGFTIVELLVVITIMALLISLALLATNNVREGVRRTACMHNQTRLVLGMSAHDARHSRIPSAYSFLNLTTSPSSRRTVSWAVQILPYIERNDLVSNLLEGKGWTSSGGGGGNNTKFQVDEFTCPSIGNVEGDAGRCHYFANVGTGQDEIAEAPLARNDGVLVTRDYAMTIGGPVPPQKALEDIASGDGLAHTMMFSEAYKSNVSFNWNGDVSGYFTDKPHLLGQPQEFRFSSTSPCLGMQRDNPPVTQPINGNYGNFFWYTPFSLHAGGAVAAFCDGHATFLSERLPVHVYAQLLTSRSVWDGNASYASNTSRANGWLQYGSAPKPYQIDPDDLR